jgi:hypothetical protein
MGSASSLYNKGDSSTPVYFKGGIPERCSVSLPTENDPLSAFAGGTGFNAGTFNSGDILVWGDSAEFSTINIKDLVTSDKVYNAL